MRHVSRVKIILMCIFSLSVLIGGVSWADEVEDVVTEALDYYKKGDFTNAAGNLDYAAQLIRQQKGGELQAFLPEPLAGWTADEASSEAMGAAMFGGGITAERKFTKADSRVTVQLVADSPMLQGMMMMFSNPAFATSDGGKLERIAGQKAIVKYSESDKVGEIKVAVANRFLVMVEGASVTKDELKSYIKAIDFAGLEAVH